MRWITPVEIRERSTSVLGESVLFVLGDRSMSGSISFDRRVIVLTSDELELYMKKFGPAYPARIRHFVIDHSGTRAILELNESWRGVTYLFEKTEDGWKSTMIAMWIS